MIPTALADPDSKGQSLRQSTYQIVYRYYTYFPSFFESFVSCNFLRKKRYSFSSLQTDWIVKSLYLFLQVRREIIEVPAIRYKIVCFTACQTVWIVNKFSWIRFSFWILHNPLPLPYALFPLPQPPETVRKLTNTSEGPFSEWTW